jgi:hypothetical protein
MNTRTCREPQQDSDSMNAMEHLKAALKAAEFDYHRARAVAECDGDLIAEWVIMDQIQKAVHAICLFDHQAYSLFHEEEANREGFEIPF